MFPRRPMSLLEVYPRPAGKLGLAFERDPWYTSKVTDRGLSAWETRVSKELL